MNKPELKKANALMSKYAALIQQRKDLLDTIMEEMKGIEDGMKQAQLELIELGNEHKASFDSDGNLLLEDGYLHIAKVTEIVTTKKFALKTFAATMPDMIKIEMKVAPIKKAFLDEQQRKELKLLGITIDTSDKMEVKANQPK